jgi:hypothetical protein
MDDIRRDFLTHPVDLIYGTIRLVEPDRESALPWARDQYACVIFNLHVDHYPRGIVNAREAFVRLIDHAIAHGGSYYLTYHRFARPDQIITCHPDLPGFIARKQRLDPEGVFQSDWYRDLLVQISSTTVC